MDSKLMQTLFIFVVVFLAKIAIADPMRDASNKTGRPQYLSSRQLQDRP